MTSIGAGAKSSSDGALAHFAARLRFEDLPATTVAITKRMILDSLGTALAATTLGAGCREVITLMTRHGGPPQSNILGTTTKISAPNAAFANGALVHALNYDAAGVATGHLGVVCLAAPLAVAQAQGGVSGRDFIAAAAAGCEITARITSALTAAGVAPSERYLSGQLLSYFGAAAASARLLGLDKGQMRSALAIALMQAAGSRQVVMAGDPPAKAIYGAFPCQAGVLAGELAKEGLGADVPFLTGPAGLYAMVYNEQYDPLVLTSDLGRSYLLEDVDIKPWAASNHLHRFIAAGLRLHKLGLSGAEIDEVEFVVAPHLRPWCEPVEVRRQPPNAAAAANSLVFCVAKALLKGSVRLDDFTTDGLNDEAANVIAQRSVHRWQADREAERVIVRLRDGSRLEQSVIESQKDQEQDALDTLIEAKFRDCCAHAETRLSDAQAAHVIRLVSKLEQIVDVSVLAEAAAGLTPSSDG